MFGRSVGMKAAAGVLLASVAGVAVTAVFAETPKKPVVSPTPAPVTQPAPVPQPVAEPAPPPADQQQKRPVQLDRNSVVILVRSVMIAVDQGNKANNYVVLQALGAPALQQLPAQRLADAFATLRQANVDLSNTLVLPPELSEMPFYDARGLLHLNGSFPAVGQQILFELVFAPVNNVWKIFDLNIRSAPAVMGPAELDKRLKGTAGEAAAPAKAK